MNLQGWVRTSLIDYPGHIASVLFTAGCNFRCPMCHNAELVLDAPALPALSEDEVWSYLAKRAGKVSGLVLSGGEPTLQPDLLPFLRQARARDLAIKLDTNGYRPDVLAALLDEGLLDYVAMDIKAPPSKYAQLSGVPDIDLTRIERSVALLRGAGVRYEFRTTVVPGLLDGDDVDTIARWIHGAPCYVLQQFRGADVLDASLRGVRAYDAATFEALAALARAWLPEVLLRGV